MNDNLYFRRINEIEKQIIINNYSNISIEFSKIIENLTTRLYISIDKLKTKNKFPNIYLIPESQIKLLTTLDNNKIISVGLYFGFIKKGNFYLSLEGAEFLYFNKIISGFKKVQVNNNGEKSILYGNNLLKKMILAILDSFEQNDILLIFNKNEEILALAQSKIDYQFIQKVHPNKVIAKNLIDKGFYLREKQ
ncbi:MAG: PUA domain-containing protein [Promethearchaeota archaeon]